MLDRMGNRRMPPNKFLFSVNLQSGASQRTYRDEVSDGAITACRELLRAARHGPTPIPGLGEYTLAIEDPGTRDITLVVRSATYGSLLLTLGIGTKSLGASKLWMRLTDCAVLPVHESLTRRPPEPWIAIRPEPGIASAPEGDASALTNLAPLLGWAWVELVKGGFAQ